MLQIFSLKNCGSIQKKWRTFFTTLQNFSGSLRCFSVQFLRPFSNALIIVARLSYFSRILTKFPGIELLLFSLPSCLRLWLILKMKKTLFTIEFSSLRVLKIFRQTLPFTFLQQLNDIETTWQKRQNWPSRMRLIRAASKSIHGLVTAFRSILKVMLVVLHELLGKVDLNLGNSQYFWA